ncbi:PHA/PHB synthase family protein [Rhizobium halophytocola]|uniref:Polyhydroxyalkanoate synthase n=1 Tax=Rhizobium halophytocola TaxID=735519 RepID=A0ABS4DUK6_9HYPH|nr:alpha/beta fold hydrolase [Rhizobium halophytocola]MBP1849389.1 polyhydroxyalkanoate synthase [Rhizobium halophytocola]
MSGIETAAAGARRRKPEGTAASRLSPATARPQVRAPAAAVIAASGNPASPASVPGEIHDRALHDLDHLFHAALASLTAGLSPASLMLAWQDWAMHLAMSPGKMLDLQSKALEKAQRLAHFLADFPADGGPGTPCISPLPQDRRFRHPAWQRFPYNLIHQHFLLTQQFWHNATTGVPGVTRRHERLAEFYSRQFLDMLSPSNILALNPEVLERTVQQGGANLVTGLQNWLDDLVRRNAGEVPPGAEQFRPGIEVAKTPGDVVFRNDLMELIRYRPKTARVKAEPVLIVPAWIMKYYILDLSPENSLVGYLLGHGFEVLCISWKNPTSKQRDLSLDDYRERGVMAALDWITRCLRKTRIHGVGYCLGGTLLSIAAAAMARDGDGRLASLSLFAAQVDFEEPGELGLFVDESQIALLEDVMWTEGTLSQRKMAGAFQMLRSQDLVWSRVIREYLLGERPPMNDLMAWNADATRMPYRMHSQYLRQLYLDNDLAQGRFRVDGRPVHVEDIAVPAFAVGTVTDHVAPWRSVFKLIHLLDVDVDFVLTSGGHNAGIVSEPGHRHRSYRHQQYRHGTPHPDPDRWVAETQEEDGSWWPVWIEWLRRHSSGDIEVDTMAPAPAAICPAPGTYVLER